MKQGIKQLVEVTVEIDLDTVEKVEFVFAQNGGGYLTFEYPSDRAIRIEDTQKIGLIWTAEETYLFDTHKHIHLDTRVTMKDSEYQPETEETVIVMKSTRFKE